MLGIGFYFIHEGTVIQRYLQRRTNFAVYEEPISVLPTIVTYVTESGTSKISELKLQEDFDLQFTQTSYAKLANLSFGNNHIKGSNLIVLLSLTHKRWFKLTPQKFKLGMPLEYKFMYRFKNVTQALNTDIVVYLSPENGSLPCSGVYRDGEVKQITTSLGTLNSLTITPQKITHCLDSAKCRSQPYGDVLVEKFLKIANTSCLKPCIRNGFCQLLDEKVTELPVCSDENQMNCFDEVLGETQNKILVQPCTKLQYKVKNHVQTFREEYQHMTVFQMAFDPPRVHVEDEYLIYDLLALISSVGGTMGLCIGFSFSNIASMTLKLLGQIRNRLIESKKIEDNGLFVKHYGGNSLSKAKDHSCSVQANVDYQIERQNQLIFNLEAKLTQYEERLSVVESK